VIGCEIEIERKNKELQLLSTERPDKAKVTAVTSLYYHSPVLTVKSTTLIQPWSLCIVSFSLAAIDMLRHSAVRIKFISHENVLNMKCHCMCWSWTNNFSTWVMSMVESKGHLDCTITLHYPSLTGFVQHFGSVYNIVSNKVHTTTKSECGRISQV